MDAIKIPDKTVHGEKRCQHHVRLDQIQTEEPNDLILSSLPSREQGL